MVGKGNEESGRQVQRFIRLTNLISELLDMVDEKKISFIMEEDAPSVLPCFDEEDLQ